CLFHGGSRCHDCLRFPAEVAFSGGGDCKFGGVTSLLFADFLSTGLGVFPGITIQPFLDIGLRADPREIGKRQVREARVEVGGHVGIEDKRFEDRFVYFKMKLRNYQLRTTVRISFARYRDQFISIPVSEIRTNRELPAFDGTRARADEGEAGVVEHDGARRRTQWRLRAWSAPGTVYVP